MAYSEVIVEPEVVDHVSAELITTMLRVAQELRVNITVHAQTPGVEVDQ